MTPLKYIRTEVFEVDQDGLAELLGITQATVSRWETGKVQISDPWKHRMREAAEAQNKRLEMAWFFDVPGQDAE